MQRLLPAFASLLGAVAATQPAAARDSALAHVAVAEQPLITIARVDHAPKLADFLEMKPGPEAPLMSKVVNFIQLNPKDGAPAQQKTEVYIGYDDKNFYAVFVCFDESTGKIRARMTRREDIDSNHDEVQLYLDTFNDRHRAFGFMINPVGIQFDYIWTDDGGYDASWDAVWDSSGKVTEAGYVAMMSIPFKSLRFPKTAEQTWGIIFQRVVPHSNDNSFYPRVSSSIQGRLSQEGVLKGLANISPGRNIQLNPYVTGGPYRVLDQRNPNYPFFTANNFGGDAGLDGKMVFHDSLVFDFTINPDFRQLESDQPQNTVNQRFEVFFPEKRPFFQEGANFFSTPVNLYFTRRIVDPQFGARLYGKTGPWGLGLLLSDDQSPGRSVPDDDPLRRKRAYFAVGRLSHDLWKQSQIGVFYSDREMAAVPPDQTICDDNALTTTEQISCVTNANRVGGLDFTLHFGNHFQTQGQALVSSNDEADGTHLAGGLYDLFGEWSSRHVEYTGYYKDVTSGFVTLTGFFQRPDVRRENQFFQYSFRPESTITSYGMTFFHQLDFDHQGVNLDYDYEPGVFINLKANTSIQAWHGFNGETLRPSDYSALPANTSFTKGYTGVFLSNSYFKLVTFNANYNFARAINYDPPTNEAPFLANEVSGTIGATVHPWNPLTVDNSYIQERLTSIANPSRAIINSYIIRSKWNYQYNPRLSFRTIFQYNGLLSNPLYTSLEKTKQFNIDFLMTYLIHPGTAFYVGYNSDLQNYDPTGITDHTGLFRTNKSYINDGRVIFAKISYLFRF